MNLERLDRWERKEDLIGLKKYLNWPPQYHQIELRAGRLTRTDTDETYFSFADIRKGKPVDSLGESIIAAESLVNRYDLAATSFSASW